MPPLDPGGANRETAMSIAAHFAGRARGSAAPLAAFLLRPLDDRARFQAMSDHMLKDIGLTRVRIGGALRHAGEPATPQG